MMHNRVVFGTGLLLLFLCTLMPTGAMVHSAFAPGLQEAKPLLTRGYSKLTAARIKQGKFRECPVDSSRRLRGGAASLQASISSEFLLKTVAPICGILISWTMFAAPIPAVLKARKEGNLGDVNPLPYPAQCGNCLSWLTYAILVQNPFIMAPNIVGLALGLFFTSTGLSLSKGEQNAALVKSFTVYATVVCGAILTERMGWVKHLIAGKDLIGWVGNILLMIYYASPLSTIASVIKTKNADSIDGNLAIAGFLNGMFWFTYGVAIWDGYVAIPNFLGAILALVSSTCWFLYKK